MDAQVVIAQPDFFQDTTHFEALPLALQNRFGPSRCLSSNELASVWWVRTEHGPTVVKAFALNQQSAYRREAALALGIRHCCVVRCLDTFVLTSGHSCLMYEYLGSGSVADLAAQTSVHDMLVRQIAIQSLQGLAALHDKGYVHCDIKPANILGGRCSNLDDIQFKIADLGSAATLKEAKSGRHGIGSPAYCAPERLYCQFDLTSDLYSIGVTIFELLCGHLPFMGGVEEIYRAHITRQPPLGDIRSERWREWLSRLLAKAPRDRFANANVALQALPFEEAATGEQNQATCHHPISEIVNFPATPAQASTTLPSRWLIPTTWLRSEEIYLPYEVDHAESACGVVVIATHRGLMRWRLDGNNVTQLSAAAPPCVLTDSKLLFSAANNIISLDIPSNQRRVLLECDGPVLALASRGDWLAVAESRKVFVQRIATGEISCALRHKHYALEPLLSMGTDRFVLSGGLGNHELWIRHMSGDILRHIVGKGPWLALRIAPAQCLAICAQMGAAPGQLELHRIAHDGAHHVEILHSSSLNVAVSDNFAFYRDRDNRLAWLSVNSPEISGTGPAIESATKLYVDQDEKAVITARNTGEGCVLQRLVLSGENI